MHSKQRESVQHHRRTEEGITSIVASHEALDAKIDALARAMSDLTSTLSDAPLASNSGQRPLADQAFAASGSRGLGPAGSTSGIPLPFAYEQFSRGVVDGTIANFGGIKEFRLSKFIKFATPIPGGVGNTSIFIVINRKKFDGFSKSIRDAIMRVSGEKFGEYSAGWDTDNRASTRLLKKEGIQEIPLPPKEMTELRKRWSVIEPKWIKDAAKLGIDSKAAVRFYRDQLIKIEGVK